MTKQKKKKKKITRGLPSTNDYGAWRVSTPARLLCKWDVCEVYALHCPPDVPVGWSSMCLPYQHAFPSLCHFLIPQVICPGITTQTDYFHWDSCPRVCFWGTPNCD